MEHQVRLLREQRILNNIPTQNIIETNEQYLFNRFLVNWEQTII